MSKKEIKTIPCTTCGREFSWDGEIGQGIIYYCENEEQQCENTICSSCILDMKEYREELEGCGISGIKTLLCTKCKKREGSKLWKLIKKASL